MRARESGEHEGAFPITVRHTAGDFRGLPAGGVVVKAGQGRFDHGTRASVMVGRKGVGEKSHWR